MEWGNGQSKIRGKQTSIFFRNDNIPATIVKSTTKTPQPGICNRHLGRPLVLSHVKTWMRFNHYEI